MQIRGGGGAGGGSGRSDSKARYAKLSLSSLLGYHSFSQLAFIAGAPQAGLYYSFQVLSPHFFL